MPSIHDPLLDLLRSDPTPLLRLLRARRPGLPLTGWTARSEQAGRPKGPQRQPDLVLMHPEVPLVLILEVQLRRDARKLRTWPYYAATAELRHDCDALLVVLTLSPAVARWARGPHHKAWGSLRYLVLGPDELPDPGDDPAMLVLAALAKGRRDHALVERALLALGDVDEERARMYLELMQDHLPHIAPKLLELMMNARRKRSESVQRLIEEFSKMVGREEGREEGREQGASHARREDVARLLRRLRREQEIEGLATLDLAALDRLFERLLDEVMAVGGGGSASHAGV